MSSGSIEADPSQEAALARAWRALNESGTQTLSLLRARAARRAEAIRGLETAGSGNIIRLGEVAGPSLHAGLPIIASLANCGHLLVVGPRSPVRDDLVRSVLLRLVLGSAPGSVQLTLVDPVDAGAGLAAFLALPASLRGSRVLVSPEEIETELRTLNRHVESVVQTRLGSRYADIGEYNAANPAVSAARRVITILGLPDGGWTERQFDLLTPVLRNGPRAGVHVLATVDDSSPASKGFDLDAVRRSGTAVRVDADGICHVDDGELRGWSIGPDALPDPEEVRQRLAAIGEAAAAPRTLPFDAVAPPLDWSGSSASEMAAPIGLNDRGDVHSFRVSDDPGPDVLPAHALIGGQTRMGKTNLLQVLIASLTARYSPDEVRLYLLDLREGVGFAPYRTLPHARAIDLETEREFALSVLRELSREIKVRGKLFTTAGTGDKFKDYRLAGNSLPRILAIIDEFQVLVTQDDPISREAATILEDLVRRGGGFGIHLVLSSQSPSVAGAYLPRLYGQMGLRIALRCPPQDSAAILGDGNGEAAGLAGAGLAIYNDQLGRRQDNHHVRVAYLPRAELDTRIAGVVARDAGAHPRPITFESAAPALLGNCERLSAAMAGTWRPEPGTADAFLGEPLEIRDGPTCARFEGVARSNLVVAGPDESEAYGLLAAALESLAAQQPDAVFDVVETARPSSPVAGVFSELASRFKGRVTSWNSREAGPLLQALAGLLSTRVSSESVGESDRYLVVTGLHRWRELRSSDSKPTPEAATLLKLLDEGPEHGLHAIVWTDGHAAIERVLKRGGVGLFDLRAVLRVPDADSQDLLDSSAAAALGDNRALFRDEQWPLGQLEKFKPFRPTEAE